ncbi:peptidoglycan-binding domain-containing protein [Microvirga solisilvae]|uniref:peptidoglycan-binding domain-containing protein n=1 Tax=Microvirga solisilvae TaxID=2919498 RepID=UPI001FAF9FAE|nr:peptidoglycan-binding domain-containing protein [Microvirga solisilvae]
MGALADGLQLMGTCRGEAAPNHQACSFDDGMMIVRDAFLVEPDDDLDLPAVVRRKAPPRPQQKRASRQAPRKIGMGEKLVSQAANNPGRVAAALFLTGCAGVIAWNALVLQNVRHPAPLFNVRDPAMAGAPMPLTPPAAQPLPPTRPGEAPEAQALAAHEQPLQLVPPPVEPPPAPAAPAPRASSRSAISDLIRSNGTPAPAPQPQRVQQAAVQASAPVQAPVRAPTVRDPIAEMIRLGGPVPTPPANVGQPASDGVLAGQRALARLGYGVRVDGEMGPGTRQAIQKFEQDRRLPITGTFNARTARELSAASGIAVQ